MKVFVNSLPKSGTNLMEKLVLHLGMKRSGRSVASSNIIGRHSFLKSILHQDHFRGRSIPVGLEVPISVSASWLDRTLSIPDGQYLSGHAAYSEQLDFLVKRNNLRMIQIYRDPRAVLVSWAKYVAEESNSWYPFNSYFKSLSLKERIYTLISGGNIGRSYYSSFPEILRRSEGWLKSDNSIAVRYEDIVGEKGGGDDIRQYEALRKILEYLSIPMEAGGIRAIQNDLYGGTHTFRGGTIEGWAVGLDEETKHHIDSSLKGGKIFEFISERS